MRFVAVFLLGCVAANSQSLAILPPSLDASGQTIFFGSSLSPDGLRRAIDIYARDSRGVRRLTQIGTDTVSTVLDFTISTDGSHFAYAGVVGVAEVLRSVNLNTGESNSWSCVAELCSGSHTSLHITGPDNRIIISGVRRTQLPAEIYTANADATFTFLARGILAPSPQRVISGTGLVVFTQDRSIPANVYVMNLDGSNPQPLTHFPVPPRGVYLGKVARDATISQSGGLVVFATTDAALENRSQIWAVTADGLLRNLTGSGENCESPSLSSDGTLAAFVCNGQLNISRTDGTARRALTSFRWSGASSPVISADGSRVVFTIGPAGNVPTARGAIWSIGTDAMRLETVYAPRVLNSGGVVDSLSIDRSVSIGDLITAFGASFTVDSLSVAAERPLPDSLNGISLLVNGRAVPILAVTPWQINAQLPPGVPEGPATFQVRFEDASTSNTTTQQVAESAPQPLFITSDTYTYPDCQFAVFHAGTGIPADQQHPATTGEAVEIYAIGLGPTDPVIPAGMPAPASPPAKAIGPITVYVADYSRQVTATVLFAGLTPGLIGIYQINITVPQGMPGRRQLALRVKDGPGLGTSCVFWVR
jgi:uncharacterized protein (TIGR03437 family)